MNPLALLRRSVRLPPPRYRGEELGPNFRVFWVNTAPSSIHFNTELHFANASDQSGFLIAKNLGPGVVHVIASPIAVTVSVDGEDTDTVAGWPLQVGEMEHFEFDGESTLYVVATINLSALWLRLG